MAQIQTQRRRGLVQRALRAARKTRAEIDRHENDDGCRQQGFERDRRRAGFAAVGDIVGGRAQGVRARRASRHRERQRAMRARAGRVVLRLIRVLARWRMIVRRRMSVRCRVLVGCRRMFVTGRRAHRPVVMLRSGYGIRSRRGRQRHRQTRCGRGACRREHEPPQHEAADARFAPAKNRDHVRRPAHASKLKRRLRPRVNYSDVDCRRPQA